MSVVGIDIGAQYSKVAVGYCNAISMVPNDQFKLSTLSLIGYTEKQREFGDGAEVIYNRNYENTIRNVKRFLGRDYDDPNLMEELYKWNYCKVDRFMGNTNKNEDEDEDENEHRENEKDDMMAQRLVFEVTTSEGRQRLTPEQILASYLRKLKELTSKYLEGAEVKDCVITCPIYFTDVQRRSLMAAAQVVGLNVVHLLNEPTAVAISYALSRKLEEFRRVMFVDMGYSNTQISVVDFQPNQLRMYAVSSDAFLGARDFDYMLFDYFRMQFEKKYNIDLSEYPRARIRLMQGVERVKQLLTANKDAIHMLECLVNDIDFNLHITRSEFEILCAPLLYKLETCLRNVIDQMHKRDTDIDSNLNHPPLIHSVEIVGGGTRIRCVQEKLVSVLKQYLPECHIDKCSATLNGDECIARGAALMCAKESPIFKTRELQIQDINHWPVLLKYPAKALSQPTSINQQIIFPLNSSCPGTTTVLFDQKKSFKIELGHPITYETEGNELQYPMKCNLAIGTFQISGTNLSRNDAINCQTELSLSLNKHGLLEIPQAQLVDFSPTNEQIESMSFDDNNESAKSRIIQNLPVTGKFYSEITSQTINRWIHLENKLANTDQIIKEMNDRRNELETYVYDMRNKLESSHNNLMSESNKEAFLKKLDDIENWLYDEEKATDSMAYMNKLQELKKFNDMMLKKQQEASHRSQRIAQSKKDVDNYQQLADINSESEERGKVYPEMDDWLSNKTTRQNKHQSYDNPEVATDFPSKKAKKLQ